MPKLFVLILAAVLVVACSNSSTEALTATLRSEARNLIHGYDLPGITVAIASPDGVISIAVGRADRERDRAVSPETTMLAASIGKTFVDATVLQLFDEGQLDLDEPISNWLGGRDWFADLPNAETIRVRHLLQHTSGLPDHVHMDAFAGLAIFIADEETPDGWIKTGRAFERFALRATVLGIRHVHVNMPIEVAELRPAFANWLGVPGRRPDLVIRFGKAPAMPMSMRRSQDCVLVRV